VGALLVVCSGCASDPVMVLPRPPVNAESLGIVEGTGAGGLGILGTAYYFIPMGINGRVERAYEDALSKAPGATCLRNVTIRENWYWYVIGTWRHVTIRGEAVK
jgi:hypothetical protein